MVNIKFNLMQFKETDYWAWKTADEDEKKQKN